jgi:hypothetical protein
VERSDDRFEDDSDDEEFSPGPDNWDEDQYLPDEVKAELETNVPRSITHKNSAKYGVSEAFRHIVRSILTA